MEVTVSEEGEILGARVIGGDGSPLEAASLAAAIEWRFSPTTLNGVPIKVVGTIAFNFKKMP